MRPDGSAAAQETPATGADVESSLIAIDELCMELARFMRLVKRIGARLTSGSAGIEFAGYALLGHIVCDGPMRTTALADVVHADPSTVSRQVAALVRHGLLERKADPIDGRASLLVATADGQTLFEGARRERAIVLAKVLADWPKEDLTRLHGLLDRLNTDCEASEFV